MAASLTPRPAACSLVLTGAGKAQGVRGVAVGGVVGGGVVGPAVGPRLAASSIALSPPELRRLGIMLPAVALGKPL